MKRKHRKIFSLRKSVFLILILLIATFGIRAVKASRWDGHRRLTLIIDSRPLLLLSIEPNSKRALMIRIPGSTQLNVPYGYAAYPASSVYQLGLLDTKRGGGKLLTKSIENTFAVAVDGYFAFKDSRKDYSFPSMDSKTMKKNYFTFSSLFLSPGKFMHLASITTSNFSTLDKLKIWNSIRTIRSDKIVQFDLEEGGILSTKSQPDGTSVKIVDQDRFDTYVGDSFLDQQIRADRTTIEVSNATNQDKLASLFAAILTHLGANVIIVSNAPVRETYSCKIYLSRSELRQSGVVSRIIDAYSCTIDDSANYSGQTDIKIVLGEGITQ